MRIRIIVVAVLLAFASGVGHAQYLFKSKPAKFTYAEVDYEDLIHRYVEKTTGHKLEGIYSVSCVITKRSKKLLNDSERIRIVARKDNYARIAILKDKPGSKHDFIEVTLSYRDAKRYPIVGEFNLLSEGEGMIYNHIEPNGNKMPFSMLSENDELLEAEYTRMEKRATITYRLSYLKIYPKASDISVVNN